MRSGDDRQPRGAARRGVLALVHRGGSALGDWGRFSELQISRNRGTRLPTRLGDWGRFSELQISRNRGTRLPTSVANPNATLKNCRIAKHLQDREAQDREAAAKHPPQRSIHREAKHPRSEASTHNSPASSHEAIAKHPPQFTAAKHPAAKHPPQFTAAKHPPQFTEACSRRRPPCRIGEGSTTIHRGMLPSTAAMAAKHPPQFTAKHPPAAKQRRSIHHNSQRHAPVDGRRRRGAQLSVRVT